MRLVRTYKVLNETANAQKAYDQARKALSADSTAQRNLAALARELALDVRLIGAISRTFRPKRLSPTLARRDAPRRRLLTRSSFQMAAMHFRDPADDLQTKTRSLQPISLECESPPSQRARAAVVENGKARTGTGGHDDRRPFSGVLDGVVDQIAQGVLDQGAMAAKRFGLPLLERDRPAGIENQGGERGDDMLRHLDRIDRLRRRRRRRLPAAPRSSVARSAD